MSFSIRQNPIIDGNSFYQDLIDATRERLVNLVDIEERESAEKLLAAALSVQSFVQGNKPLDKPKDFIDFQQEIGLVNQALKTRHRIDEAFINHLNLEDGALSRR